MLTAAVNTQTLRNYAIAALGVITLSAGSFGKDWLSPCGGAGVNRRSWRKSLKFRSYPESVSRRRLVIVNAERSRDWRERAGFVLDRRCWPYNAKEIIPARLTATD